MLEGDRLCLYSPTRQLIQMDREREGAPEPGFFSGIRREVGKIEGEIRDGERSHEQREADKYENRAEKDAEKEKEDFNEGRFP